MEYELCKNGHPYDEKNTYIYPKTGRRMCRTCHREAEWKRVQSPEAKKKNSARMREWRLANPERYSALLKTRRRKIFNWLAELKHQSGCTVCKNENEPVCLDFHHRDPTIKGFTVSRKLGGSKALVLEEIAKCDVLCANCHRIRTWSNYAHA